MRLGLKTAMAELKDEGREPERQFDVEFGYDDEDPIERHVKLFLTPRRAQDFRGRQNQKRMEAGMDEDENMSDDDDEEEEEAQIIDLNSPAQPQNLRLGQFQPGLIQFRKSFRQDAPFIGRNDSGGSTPGSGGTGRSESSFEAIRSEDYVSMSRIYGTNSSSDRDRLSIISTSTTCSSATVIASKPPGLFPRLSLLRPRPRAHPYTEGGRQREDSAEMVRGINGGVEESEDDWLAGRSISETMVAKAGLRCQRGRTRR